MPLHETYRNDRESTEEYEDLGGRPAIRPGAGKLPTEQLFPERTVYNLDGTVTEPVEEGSIISRVPICATCLRPVKSIKDLTLWKNRWVCDTCLDEGGPMTAACETGIAVPAPEPISCVYAIDETGLQFDLGDGAIFDGGCDA